MKTEKSPAEMARLTVETPPWLPLSGRSVTAGHDVRLIAAKLARQMGRLLLAQPNKPMSGDEISPGSLSASGPPWSSATLVPHRGTAFLEDAEMQTWNFLLEVLGAAATSGRDEYRPQLARDSGSIAFLLTPSPLLNIPVPPASNFL